MLWLENLRMALAAIWAHKMRSFLTVIGIVIGVAVVIGVQGILQGLTGIILNQIQGLGSNTLVVEPYRPPGKEGEKLARIELTLDDADALRRLCPNVKDLSTFFVSGAPIKKGEEHTNAPVVGTTASFQEVRSFYVDKGRFFSSVDDAHRARVCVIGVEIAKNLKLKGDPIGQTIQIAGQDFTIVGVMEKRGELFGQSFDNFLLVPISTSASLFGEQATKRVQILIRAVSDNLVEQTMDQVTDVLRRRHGLKPGQPDDFRVQSQAQLLKLVSTITNGIAIGAAVIVGFALLVASIGVTNIMLVSVTERTREIGIRKAIGARSSNILTQFLIEAVTLCCFGGAIGLGAGFGFSVIGHSILSKLLKTEWPPINIPIHVYVLGFVVPAIFGVIAGLWPAYKAAKLDPIESLRYE
jgi:putative ABC transport system permease protein